MSGLQSESFLKILFSSCWFLLCRFITCGINSVWCSIGCLSVLSKGQKEISSMISDQN